MCARLKIFLIHSCYFEAKWCADSGQRFMQARNAAEECYGEFSNLVADEGDPVGQEVFTSSSIDCQIACTNFPDCQSFSLCPQWNRCWMKDRVLIGSEKTRALGQCRTYYKRSCSGPTLPPTPAPTPHASPPADMCYGNLANLVVEEGSTVGQRVFTSSSTECQKACSNNANCQSFSLCPEYNGCWMKDRRLIGSETTRVLGQCRTYYKRPCSGPTLPPTPLPTPTPPPADICYGNFANLVVEEGSAIGQQLITSSSTECQIACSNNADCQSFSLCPQWNQCWMKDRGLIGSETTRVLDQCRTYYKRPCSSPTQAPTKAPTPPRSGPYCGIAVKVYECRAEAERLRAIDPQVGSSFEEMCMGYGGTHPPAWEGKTADDRDLCTLNINNDCDHWFQESGQWRCAQNYGISKNPDNCHGHYFFLWDEPGTQGLNAVWAAQQWRRHVNIWGPQIESLRARGTRITTPLFTDHQGLAREKFQAFFASCGSECSDPSSNYYIDVLAMNQWLRNPQSSHSNQEEWIKNEATHIRQSNGNRPMILGNFAWLGASTADQQVEVIANSRIWNRSWSGLEAVFYFGAIDFGGSTSHNFLYSQTSTGSNVGAALVSRCQTSNR